jgi:hypothetical protein
MLNVDLLALLLATFKPHAWVLPLLALCFTLVALLGSARFKGRRGERRVARLLRRYLPADTYRVMHDVTLPAPEGTTQIDHICVSRFGIYVLETKHYSGWIFGCAQDHTWTQTLRRRSRRFQNPLRQNHRHIRVLVSLLSNAGWQMAAPAHRPAAARAITPPPAAHAGGSQCPGPP